MKLVIGYVYPYKVKGEKNFLFSSMLDKSLTIGGEKLLKIEGFFSARELSQAL